jgi:AAA domain-containing protein
MANRDRNPPTQAQKNALRALGFPAAYLPAVRSAEDAEAILRNFRTPEEMRRFLDGGPQPNNDAGERFLAAFGSDTPPRLDPAPEPPPNVELARGDQERESPDETPIPTGTSPPPEDESVAPAPQATSAAEPKSADIGKFWTDFETLSRLNLRIVGPANYLRHKRHTRPLALFWAVDDGPVQMWKWGEPIEPLLAAIKGRLFVSHGTFDRICWNVLMVPLGLPPIAIKDSEDNMVRCQKAGIPGGLDKAAAALKFPPELQKFDDRTALEMSRPREPRSGEDPDGLYVLDDPEKWAKLIKRGTRDVEVLRALNKALPPLTEHERLEWICSELTNEEIGIYLDGLAIEKACELIGTAQQEANTKIQQLTNGKIKTVGQRDKILARLNASGAGLEDLQAETLEEFLNRPSLSDEVRGIAAARYEAADAAPLKARSMRARRWENGCAYHVFDFWRAVTGRWSSTGVQVHNVKSEGEDIAKKFAAVLSGDPERVRQFGPIMKVIGDALRAVICARPGFRFLGMDYSGIESCTLAALAGERWKVEQWKKFFRTRDPRDDPYFIIGKWLGFANDIARDYGKIADLAFGYGGSFGAWRRFAPPGDTTSDEQIKRYRDIWRQRHPATRQYLKGLDAAVLKTVQSKTLTFLGRLTLHCQTIAGHNWLYIRLPSGRSIPYPFAEIKHYVDKDGRSAVGVGFMDYQSKKWQPYKSPTGAPVIWSGLLIENVTQGIARDLLAAALVRLWAEDYPPTLHVHDEIVVEVPVGSEHSLDKYKDLCERRPDWAVEMDIPVFAKVWERQRWAEGVDIPVTHTPGAVITPDQLVKLHKNKVKKPRTPQSKSARERPDLVLEVSSDIPEPHICIYCKLDPPDGTERTLDDGIWIHSRCEAAYITTRMAEEGLSQEDAPSPQTPQQAQEILTKPNGGSRPEPDDIPEFTKGNGRPAPAPESKPPPPSDKPSTSALVPDRAEAARFLALLDRTATRFTFQTFDDDKDRRSKALARVLHGSLDDCFAELTRLNNLGAGVFVTVNETNLRGRLATDIVKVRYVFGDFDNGVPLPQGGPRRFVAVQSSATGRHGYWKPNGIALDAFTPTQELIAKRFNGDPKVKDLPRVMRLPGFWHRKGEPFMTRIIEVHEDAPACSVADFETDEFKYQAKASPHQDEANFEGLGGPWSILNTLALKHLDKWVPALFGDTAIHQPGTGAYRVSSEALGRDLEEDLSIHPTGIVDFGVADQGDERKGKRTPIDLVMEFRNVDADTAFDWLDGQLRDVEKPQTSELDEWDAGELLSGPLPAPRQWLIARYFCRRFLSGLVAPGDVGKTTLRLTQGIQLATGRCLLGQRIYHRCKVLILSFEDDRAELHRRLLAICRHYKIDTQELKGWLFCRDISGPKLAELDARGRQRQIGTLDGMLRQAIARTQCALVILDPFIKLHALNENDNPDMNFVCEQLIKIAQDCNIAVDSLAHTHKGAIQAGDADARRGASAQRDAGRLDYTLTVMTEAEAKQFSISADERKSYMRLDKAKANIVRAMKAVWFRLVNVPLKNTTEMYPEGDEVQAIERWDPPEIWTGIEPETLNTILDDLDAGMPDGRRYSTHGRATERAAWKAVQEHCPSKTEAQCREIIKVWCEAGVLVEEPYHDPVDRKEAKGLRIDPSKRPTYS